MFVHVYTLNLVVNMKINLVVNMKIMKINLVVNMKIDEYLIFEINLFLTCSLPVNQKNHPVIPHTSL